jgi:signal transduction histidine kinase
MRKSVPAAKKSRKPETRSLSALILRTHDEERRRLARQLHSTTGQSMAALQINLSLVAQSDKVLSSRARRALSDSAALAYQCALEVRELSQKFYPPLLDDLGLGPSLRAHAEALACRTGIAFEVDVPDEMDRMPQPVEIALFRIIEEALDNAGRHSHSKTAVLRVKNDRSRLMLEVIDHGRGSRNGLTGLGIATMRERARSLGGTLQIKSNSSGTRVRVKIPRSPSNGPA